VTAKNRFFVTSPTPCLAGRRFRPRNDRYASTALKETFTSLWVLRPSQSLRRRRLAIIEGFLPAATHETNTPGMGVATRFHKMETIQGDWLPLVASEKPPSTSISHHQRHSADFLQSSD